MDCPRSLCRVLVAACFLKAAASFVPKSTRIARNTSDTSSATASNLSTVRSVFGMSLQDGDDNIDGDSKSEPALLSPSRISPKKNFVYGKDDALFGAIERQQGDKPFGKLLDAGTGLHSLRWIATLLDERGMTDYTAITADDNMRRSVQQEAYHLGLLDAGSIVVGNWFATESSTSIVSNGTLPLDRQLSKWEEQYDTILADYLIGAMDGFSPYQQDQMIPKLTKLLKPGGRLYLVGLQPLPDSVNETTHDTPSDANIICRVRQIRDACILLAGHRCYREYPLSWIHRQIRGIPQLTLCATSEFPILYKHATILRQINVARSKFAFFPSTELVDSMRTILDDLERQSLEATQRSPTGTITLGFDYVVSAEKAREQP